MLSDRSTNINALRLRLRALIFRDLPSNNVLISDNSQVRKNYFLIALLCYSCVACISYVNKVHVLFKLIRRFALCKIWFSCPRARSQVGEMGDKVILVNQTLGMHVRSHFRNKTQQVVKICDVFNIMCS